MTSLVPSKIKPPEQEELEEKHRLLEELESDFASHQLEYSTLAGEIDSFRNRYYLRVGPLYARLDTIRAEIRELLSQRAPDDEAASQEAEQARQQAQQTWEEVNSAVEDDPVSFQPSADLKQIYRQAAKLIHPDRASSEEDRHLRDRLMAEINASYANGDADAIGDIVERYRDRLNAAETDDIGTQLVRAIRSVARTRSRIASLIQAVAELTTSEWAKLKTEIDEGEARGEDPLGQLAEKLHADFLAEQQRLSELLTVPTPAATAEAEILPTTIEAPTAEKEVTPPPSGFRPEGLIHRTDRGEKVRSKSEVIIANILHNLGLDYRYEFPIEGSKQLGIRRPDFVFFDAEHRPILWEHLGMLHDEQYRERWNAKLIWYEANGFSQGINLIITRDEADGSLDSQRIRKTAEYVKTLINP
ncbi:MAG: hypothetical protein KKH74_01395 [Gammaproteobacteria bacterium]|nr:hypothetical protein [Gammaproteobacteria bacterium]MBU1731916.1 hypothetical protein [Gammaproteobacteria bacterium]MBU1891271.1 hypothetical protein [Gammaproteobacteria bacterium]